MQRIYVVRSKKDDKVWLVEANNQSQALRFIADNLFEVQAATAKGTADLMAAGAKVHNATKLAAPKKAEAQPEQQTETAEAGA